jgi:hypothetical protein
MKKLLPASLLLISILFLIANRGAYEGWFSEDDLDNIAWTRAASLKDFAAGLASPKFYAQNFRPTGHLYFHLMERWNHLHFPPYVGVLQAVHLLNVFLVWLLLRRYGYEAVLAGTLFFAFHMAVFDVYWKPMYIFDALCATFILLCLLALERGGGLLFWAGVTAFWMAYKSKEHAIMLPPLLLLWEYWFGARRWKRLIPFFAISALFGVQALLFSPNVNNDYSFRFHPFWLERTVRFYSSQIFFVPCLGLALAPLPFFVKDRRFRFGLAFFAMLLLPMLFLPGRLFAAYLYVPLIGLAIAFAAIARRPLPVALFFLLWLPLNYSILREKRKTAIAQGNANRDYTWALSAAPRMAPDVRAFIYEGEPKGFKPWGVEGALKYFYRVNVRAETIDALDLTPILKYERLALVSYDAAEKRLHVVTRAPEAGEASYIAMSRETPFWQLEYGWFPRENRFRWTRPRAVARLARPPGATRFELVVNIGPDYIGAVKLSHVEVLIDGQSIGKAAFTRAGWQTVSWNMSPAASGTATIEFRVTPEFRPRGDPRVLGLPIGAFGFR